MTQSITFFDVIISVLIIIVIAGVMTYFPLLLQWTQLQLYELIYEVKSLKKIIKNNSYVNTDVTKARKCGNKKK